MVQSRSAEVHLRNLKKSTGFKVLAAITLVSSSIGIISLLGSGVASATPAMPPTMSSWYVEDVNTSTAYNTGCAHAQFANSVGTGGTVILDFGGQVNSSTLEEINGLQVSDSQVQSMVVAYANGYYNCSNGAVVDLAIGTNNSIGNGSGFGSAWAYEVNGIAEAVAPSYGSKVTIFGGSDIEPSWGTQTATMSWSQGYGSVAGYHDYIDFGSADGCPTNTDANGNCSNYWNQYGVWYVAYGSTPALSAPIIYYSVNATQWEEISLYGSTYQSLGIGFWGPVDEYPRDTSTNTSSQAWSQLTGATGQDPSFSLEFQAGSV